MSSITWHEILQLHPQFVQWVVQRFGPLPEGPIRREDYERFVAAWEQECGDE